MTSIESIEVNPSNSHTVFMENGDKYIINYSNKDKVKPHQTN